MRQLVFATILLTFLTQPLPAQEGCTVGSITPRPDWPNLPSAIAFIGTEGTSLGDVQLAMSQWRNTCSSGLPQIYYGGSPTDYAFSGTELWTVHKGRAAEVGMVGPGCAEADVTAKKIRLTTAIGR